MDQKRVTAESRPNGSVEPMRGSLPDAERQISQLMARLMHDARSPLNIINNFTQLIRYRYHPNPPPELKEYFQHIETATKNMAAVLNAIEDYTNIVLDTRSSEIVDVGQVVRRVLQKFDWEGEPVSVGTLPSLPIQEADLERLFEVLIDNCIKFRGTEPLRIDIRCEKQSRGWKFVVADNGRGIDFSEHEKLFLPKYRGSNASGVAGWGFGLFFAKTIVEKNQGTIEFEPSSSGCTLRFSVLESFS